MSDPTGLTRMQLRCMRLIQDFADRTGGSAPSLSELQSGLGLRSKSGVFRLLEGLVDRGYIERIYRSARAIKILHRLPPTENVDALSALTEALRAGSRAGDGTVRFVLARPVVDRAIAALEARIA